MGAILKVSREKAEYNIRNDALNTIPFNGTITVQESLTDARKIFHATIIEFLSFYLIIYI